MKWRDTRTPKGSCPYCDYKIDAAGSLKGAPPNEGDKGLCISCASLLVYAADLTVRRPTVVELAEFEANEKVAAEFRRYQNAVRALDRRDLPSRRKTALR